MAVDEAILENVIANKSLPTLRLYSWSPPTLSLGYAQAIKEVDLEMLDLMGWGIVRRPTGGRAILHTDELTYSVIAPSDDPRVKGSVLESYRRLSEALLNALNTIGLHAVAKEQVPQKSTISPNPVCFETPSNYEIIVEGKKLIGSAQARRKNGVLQHGSLPLFGDLARITKALVYPNESSRLDAAQRLLQRATTVELVLSKVITWEDAAAAFENAFRSTFKLKLEPGILSSEEINLANKLVTEKHSNQVWISRL